jgi:cyclic pyranopterin phosphate synthase
MICPSSKPPLTIRISVTDRCQLRCDYCMPAEGVQSFAHEDVLRFEEITTCVARLQESFDVRKVRITGGEPLVRKGIVDLVAMLSGLKIPDLAMTTNGQRLSEYAASLRDAGLHRVNISLDSLDPSTYGEITRGGCVDATIEGIQAALDADLRPVKLNMIVMRGINDAEVFDVMSFAMEHDCELRFLELMPIGHRAESSDDRFVSSASVRQKLSCKCELEDIPRTPGSSSRRCRVRRADGSEGFVGFISPCTDSFCEDCTRLRLTSDGRLIGCLARRDGIEIRPLLSNTDGDAIKKAVQEVMQCKRSDERFEQPALMTAIGG